MRVHLPGSKSSQRRTGERANGKLTSKANIASEADISLTSVAAAGRARL